MINFSCPSCGTAVHVRDRCAGKRGKCPTCQQVILIPRAPDESPELAALAAAAMGKADLSRAAAPPPPPPPPPAQKDELELDNEDLKLAAADTRAGDTDVLRSPPEDTPQPAGPGYASVLRRPSAAAAKRTSSWGPKLIVLLGLLVVLLAIVLWFAFLKK